MRAREIDLIRHLPLFAALSPDQMPELLSAALLQRFARGTRLFHQGDQPDFLHILVEGAVELSALSAEGRETTIEILAPVDSFILAAVLLDTPYLMGAQTLEGSRLLMLPAKRLRAEIAQRPDLALRMLASMAEEFRKMVRQLKDMKLRTGTERLAAYLLRLHRLGGGSGGGVTLPVPKRVLAGRLAMSPENLSRALATLRDHGVVVRGTVIELTDIPRLEAFCLPDALIDGEDGGAGLADAAATC